MLVPIQSQIIEAVSYDTAARRLFVQLRTGDAYSYADVPAHIARGLTASDSPGAYFNRVIKRYPTTRISNDGWETGFG